MLDIGNPGSRAVALKEDDWRGENVEADTKDAKARGRKEACRDEVVRRYRIVKV